MNKLKKEQGITLVALIITIVILLVLAIVSIGAVRDSKIIAHAQNARNDYTIAQEKEQLGLAVSEWQLEKVTPGTTKTFKEVITNALQGQIEPIVENADGSLTVTFTKTGNVYIVNVNGDITKQEDDIIGGGDEPTNNDFELTVEQTPNGSPVYSVTFKIRPTIPDSWRKTEFTEEEAVETVNGATIRVPNITSLEDFDKELYNFINDMSETPISGETDVSDFNALKTALSSKITLGEDPENEIFSYLMSLVELNYSTIYAAAIDMYEYAPGDYNVKIRKDKGEWIDITNKEQWSYTYYKVTANGNYEIQMQIDDKNSSTSVEIKDITNLGKYVRYDVDGDGVIETDDKYESILWRVLRDDADKVELITANVLGTEYADKVDLSSTDFNVARSKYNGAVETIIQKCIDLTGISNVRSVGGPATDTTETVVFEKLTDFETKGDFSVYESTEEYPERGLKVGDDNYEDDWIQMEKAGVRKADNSKGYWLASRYMNKTSDEVQFGVFASGSNGGYWDYYILCSVTSSAQGIAHGAACDSGVRPVLTLAAGILEGKTDGETPNQPIEIY